MRATYLARVYSVVCSLGPVFAFQLAPPVPAAAPLLRRPPGCRRVAPGGRFRCDDALKRSAGVCGSHGLADPSPTRPACECLMTGMCGSAEREGTTIRPSAAPYCLLFPNSFSDVLLASWFAGHVFVATCLRICRASAYCMACKQRLFKAVPELSHILNTHCVILVVPFRCRPLRASFCIGLPLMVWGYFWNLRHYQMFCLHIQ